MFDQSLPSWSYYAVEDAKNNNNRYQPHPMLKRFAKRVLRILRSWARSSLRFPKKIARRIRDFRFRDFTWEMGLLLRAPFTKKPKTKFIIYGSGRTGTTLCLTLLSKHPDLVADHEIFNQYHAKSDMDFDNIYRKIGVSYTPPLFFPNLSIENVAATKCMATDRKNYCFKLLSDHLRGCPKSC